MAGFSLINVICLPGVQDSDFLSGRYFIMWLNTMPSAGYFCSFFLIAQKKEPKKRAGKPQRSAGFARPAHNSLYYRGLDAL